jgi:hypothetical protein
MATIGLADAFQGVSGLAGWGLFVIAICLGLHAIVTLTRTRALSFAIMVLIRNALLGLAIARFIHLSRWPSGG